MLILPTLQAIRLKIFMLNFLLKSLVSIIFPFTITFATYLHFYGENSPGGGFIAGIILSTSFAIFQIAFENNIIIKRSAFIIMIFFMALYFLISICGLIFTESLLNYRFLSIFNIPPITIQKTGIFLVETCIMFTVFCSSYLIFLSFYEVKNTKEQN